MVPSSNSGLSARVPGSSRPPSSLSTRPTSSLSHHRPLSALSSRPLSRASTTRPSSRHAKSRIVPLCQKLVECLLGDSIDENQNDIATESLGSKAAAIEYVVRHLETTTATKTAASVDMDILEKRIVGYVEKAKINSHDKMAEALEACFKRLKENLEKERDLDQDIKMSRLPDHLQLMLSLSHSSSPSSLAYADSYLEDQLNPKSGPKPLTWEDIIADDPFEGDHWKGVYGLPPGFVKHDEDDDSDSSSSSSLLSPLRSERDFLREEILSLDVEVEEYDQQPDPIKQPPVEQIPKQDHRTAFEELRKRQYWRPDWQGNVDLDRPFSIADPSTLGPAFERMLAKEKGMPIFEAFQRLKFINEEDAVREVLMCLQGRRNLMLQWTDNCYETTEGTPRLLHLTLDAEESILSSFARTATTIRFLRSFSSSVFAQSQSNIATLCDSAPNEEDPPTVYRTTRTLEAFAAAVDSHISQFDAWCASRDEAITHALNGVSSKQVVVSLLSTEKQLQSTFEAGFDVTLNIVRGLCTLDGTVSISSYWPLSMRLPVETTTLLLNALLDASRTYAQRGDTVTAKFMMYLFIQTAEPTWKMVGKWLHTGTGITDQPEGEFFIERNDLGMGPKPSAQLFDPEFWSEGYTLRQGDFDLSMFSPSNDQLYAPQAREGVALVPGFLSHVSGMILASGKAKTLLRAMDVSFSQPTSFQWQTFQNLIGFDILSNVWYTSTSWLGQKVDDELRPFCQASDEHLAKVLVEQCGFLDHLHTIENLFLMRRGDSMSHFLDILFAKMDAQKSWADFHVLNTTFSDVVLAGQANWVDLSLIRLFYTGNVVHAQRSIARTVQTLNGLQIEYALPFPLHYILTPPIVQMYSDIFVFLVKVRRAKAVLERILLRRDGIDSQLEKNLKGLYVMRSRLSWFINTLLNFLTTHVFHVELSRFDPIISNAKSMDEIIALHTAHIEKITTLCFLDTRNSPLHQALVSILDLALHFSQMFVAFVGDATLTHDLSVSHSFALKNHSRRIKRKRRNVIGVGVPSWTEDDDSSDEDEDDEDLSRSVELISIAGHEDVPTNLSAERVEKNSAELHSLVRFIRRGVEALAGGTGSVALTFGVLAFDLEDWDM